MGSNFGRGVRTLHEAAERQYVTAAASIGMCSLVGAHHPRALSAKPLVAGLTSSPASGWTSARASVSTGAMEQPKRDSERSEGQWIARSDEKAERARK
jgi:hypothetical protein